MFEEMIEYANHDLLIGTLAVLGFSLLILWGLIIRKERKDVTGK